MRLEAAVYNRRIKEFFREFREQKRQRAGKNCVECGKAAVTFCENCESGLCAKHSNTRAYIDVDVCKNEEACERRCEIILREPRESNHNASSKQPSGNEAAPPHGAASR